MRSGYHTRAAAFPTKSTQAPLPAQSPLNLRHLIAAQDVPILNAVIIRRRAVEEQVLADIAVWDVDADGAVLAAFAVVDGEAALGRAVEELVCCADVGGVEVPFYPISS